MQEKTRKLEENARMVGLKINAKKTKLMYLNTERLPVIFVEGKQLDTVDSFNYLGSCITTEGGAEGFRSFRPQVDSAQVDPALNYKSIWPHLKLNTFELKYTSVYHFKMFLIDFNFKNSNIRIFCV